MGLESIIFQLIQDGKSYEYIRNYLLEYFDVFYKNTLIYCIEHKIIIEGNS